jgi:flagellar biosynthesis/type III secretory pathway protein FliH
VVIELKNVPRVVDPAEVQGIPELGVLSAMANPDLEVATTAVSAISVLPEDRGKLYLDVILAVLPPSVRKALEMQGYMYQSEFARKYYSQGREEGHSRGLEEGHARGLRSAVLALVRAKLGVVTSDDEAAVEALRDEQALTHLIGVLARATSALEIRTALTAARIDS